MDMADSYRLMDLIILGSTLTDSDMEMALFIIQMELFINRVIGRMIFSKIDI